MSCPPRPDERAEGRECERDTGGGGKKKKKKKGAVLEGCGVAPALRELAKVKPSKKMTCA